MSFWYYPFVILHKMIISYISLSVKSEILDEKIRKNEYIFEKNKILQQYLLEIFQLGLFFIIPKYYSKNVF